MGLREFGINLDEGFPLSNEAEFKQLYVEGFIDVTAKLDSWIQNSSRESIMLAGQIGSGKSTLINRILLKNQKASVLSIYYDKNFLNLDLGDFLSITLAAFIRYALEKEVDLSFTALPEEIGESDRSDWYGLLNGLQPQEISLEKYNKQKALYRMIGETGDYIKQVIVEIGEKIEAKTGQNLGIIALGLDKFVDTPEYQGMSAASLYLDEIIELLQQFKTLFEVNIIHITRNDFIRRYRGKILTIPRMQEETILKLLKKRKGVYASVAEDQLRIIVKLSGGNPRQAIKLLENYQHWSTALNQAAALKKSIYETIVELFAFASAPDANTMKTVNKDRYLLYSLINAPGDKDTARAAVYGNWIILGAPNGAAAFEASVNPLIGFLYTVDISQEEPETRLLREIAEEYGINPYGLDWNISLPAKFIDEVIKRSGKTNIQDILDILGGVLFDKNQRGACILAYKDRKLLNPVKDYLLAKASSYEYQTYEHFILKKEDIEQGISRISASAEDIVSIEISEDLNEKQLSLLDKKRDAFVEHKMIWWVQYDALKKYLLYWTQLRQLFSILILDNELLAGLTKEEIESDIEIFQGLYDGQEENILVDSLKKVALYIAEEKNGGLYNDHK